MVAELKKKSIDEGITDSPIVKSLIDINPLDVNDEEIIELEKAYDVKDPAALAAWIGRKKYGKKKYQELATAGKKKEKSEKDKKEEIKEIAEDVKGPELKVNEAMNTTYHTIARAILNSAMLKFINHLLFLAKGYMSCRVLF